MDTLWLSLNPIIKRAIDYDATPRTQNFAPMEFASLVVAAACYDGFSNENLIRNRLVPHVHILRG